MHPIAHPNLFNDLPIYPLTQQLIRVTATQAAGPSSVSQDAGSSFLAPQMHVAFVQQLRTDSLLPRDREPCLAADIRGMGITPGFYLGRLAGSHNSLPVYEVMSLEGATIHNLTVHNLDITNDVNFTNVNVNIDGGTWTFGGTTDVTINISGGTWTFGTSVDVDVQTTSVLIIPVLTVTGDPNWTGTQPGEMVFNAVDGSLFIWNGSSWTEIGGGSSTITIKEDGTTASTAINTLDFIEPNASLVTISPSNEANINLSQYLLATGGRAGASTQDQEFKGINYTDHTTLTISGGSVTRTQSFHVIAAQSGTADDLDTINGGANGDQLVLMADTGDVITLKHGTGNIAVGDGEDMLLIGAQILHHDGTNWIPQHWKPPLTRELLKYSHQVSGGSGDAGGFTSGSWQTRPLNTENFDTAGLGSLASNQITLDAGTYRVWAYAHAFRVDEHSIRLRDTTGNTTLCHGSSAYCQSSTGEPDSTISVIEGDRFVISVQSVIELQHRCATTKTTNGMGRDSGWGTNVYAAISLELLSS